MNFMLFVTILYNFDTSQGNKLPCVLIIYPKLYIEPRQPEDPEQFDNVDNSNLHSHKPFKHNKFKNKSTWRGPIRAY